MKPPKIESRVPPLSQIGTKLNQRVAAKTQPKVFVGNRTNIDTKMPQVRLICGVGRNTGRRKVRK